MKTYQAGAVVAVLALVTPAQATIRIPWSCGAAGDKCPDRKWVSECLAKNAELKTTSSGDTWVTLKNDNCFMLPSMWVNVDLISTVQDGQHTCSRNKAVEKSDEIASFKVSKETCELKLSLYAVDRAWGTGSRVTAPKESSCLYSDSQRCNLCSYLDLTIPIKTQQCLSPCEDSKCPSRGCLIGKCLDNGKCGYAPPNDSKCAPEGCLPGVCKDDGACGHGLPDDGLCKDEGCKLGICSDKGSCSLEPGPDCPVDECKSPADCEGHPGPCELKSCEKTDGYYKCGVQRLPDGYACDDGDETTCNDTCDKHGECQAGKLCPVHECKYDGDCHDDDLSTCQEAACKEVNGLRTCVLKDLEAHTPCDDHNPETCDDTCDGHGACAGAPCPVHECKYDGDCQDDDVPTCQEAACKEVEGLRTCVLKDLEAHTPCDDHNPKTCDDTCDGHGTCIGAPCPENECNYDEDCQDDDVPTCQEAVCKEVEGLRTCVLKDLPDGSTCDDHNDDTCDDKCTHNGECVGQACAEPECGQDWQICCTEKNGLHVPGFCKDPHLLECVYEEEAGMEKCMPCGFDDLPACTGNPDVPTGCRDEGLTNVDGTCLRIPECGGKWQPCCDADGEDPSGCKDHGYGCIRDQCTQCGIEWRVACPGVEDPDDVFCITDDLAVANDGNCQKCGGLGRPPCAGGECHADYTILMDNVCEPCGETNRPCCAHDARWEECRDHAGMCMQGMCMQGSD